MSAMNISPPGNLEILVDEEVSQWVLELPANMCARRAGKIRTACTCETFGRGVGTAGVGS